MLTDESTASNCRSLLLKMPQEIKDQIYVLVCGGNLLHINFSWNVRIQRDFSHFKCESKTTEEDAQASFDNSTSPWFDEKCAHRHGSCGLGRLTLDLRFLRTCRQIYNEAKSFCYSTNIFSFGDWTIFADFVKKVRWVSDIRKIRLCIRSGTSGNGPAPCESLQSFCSKLTGLQWFHTDWEQFCFPDSRRYDRGAAEASYLTKRLVCFAGTALKTAEVIINDARFCNRHAPETAQISRDDARSQERNRWTMTQKQEYAHFLRNALLRHRGKGIGTDGDTGSSESMRFGWNGTEHA